MSRVLLNDPPLAKADPVGAEAGEELQRRMLLLLGTYTTPEGRVDYAPLRVSGEFREVVECSRRLQRVDLSLISTRFARLAFWINVYNALVLHGIISLGVRRTVWEVWNFFGRVSYRIAGFTFSAEEIEHGILRGNRRRIIPPLRPFARRDPRLALAVGPVDPRIHFAITCGARSCPPVGVYRTAGIDAQLDLATRNFVNQEITLGSQGRIVCSKIFKWYRSDFDTTGGLAAFLLRYLDDGPVREAVAGGAASCQAFRPFRWGLQFRAATRATREPP
ncbi:MAG: DUF547 domain-containing protein [Candidatus Rokubacteria bacterium]|nr:DUF547 domain-containing protein [Candidatus Rokubacteria bacterium]